MWAKGTIVVCIRDDWNDKTADDPVKDCYYTCGEELNYYGRIFIKLMEQKRDCWYLASNFRKAESDHSEAAQVAAMKREPVTI